MGNGLNVKWYIEKIKEVHFKYLEEELRLCRGNWGLFKRCT